MTAWQPQSWQNFELTQVPTYDGESGYHSVLSELGKRPPLVAIDEIQRLQRYLALAADDKAFILQGGDCAESFAECTADSVSAKIKILLQMSLMLLEGIEQPIVCVGRIAGQFAKPRSSLVEAQDSLQLPSYQGDLINAPEFAAELRTPDPQRMLRGYDHAAFTLNYLRSLLCNGFNDLNHAEDWRIAFDQDCPFALQFEQLAKRITRSLALYPDEQAIKQHIPFFTSHEALLLPFEAALTRQEAGTGKWYNLSTHFPWLGMRTAFPGSAHVEFLRGIENPIAIKVGPELTPDVLLTLLATLNPNNIPGKIMAVHRLGLKSIESHLPALLTAVKENGHPLVWCCDPMHGNTRMAANGIKTRYFDDIVQELKLAIQIHRQHKVALNGLHFEMTAENVTECIGGHTGITENDLHSAYKSLVDPRLNYQQAMEIASLIGAGV